MDTFLRRFLVVSIIVFLTGIAIAWPCFANGHVGFGLLGAFIAIIGYGGIMTITVCSEEIKAWDKKHPGQPFPYNT